MSKIRVYELAKKLEISNKELIAGLNEMGVEVKSHSSSIDEELAERYAKRFNDARKAASAPKAEEKKTENKPEKKAEGGKDKAKNNKSEKAESNKEQNRKDNKNRNGKNMHGDRPSGEGGSKGGNKNRDMKNNKNGGTANDKNKDKGSNFTSPKPTFNAPQNKKNNKKNKKNKKNKLQREEMPVQEIAEDSEDDIKIVQIGDTITVKDLADKLNKAPADIVMRLMKKNVMASINQEIEFELAEAVCDELDVIAERAEEIDLLEEEFREEEDREEDLVVRPPVVVVMGHVDHGKTSLLDAIRHSNVTTREAGGITQHIGAYTVAIDGKPITFLDTPGHEAFTAMRMRGAQVTDIAVLVVAADDGVMPQTIEAINHAKAAGVEIIVAINKIDKPSANPERVKQELVEYGLISEDWGGDTICVPVSASTKEGIDQLLEMIILVAEMKELKANPAKRARGSIIEAQLDKGRGAVATVLVQSGTLNVGDPVVAGSTFGRIRAMMNDKGQKVKKAGPSMPVEILGLNEVPRAGDMFYVAQSEKHARQVAESVAAKDREELIKDTPQKVSLDDLFSQIQSGNIKELNIVIKADVQGSVEAVRASLEKLSNDEVRIRTIHGGVGAVTESDVMLASASNAIIIGFNVRPEASAKSVADDQKVDIRLYRVIYNAIEDITAAMKGLLDPVYEEKIIGHAEVRQIFRASGVGTIGGAYVKDGKIQRNAQVRVVRDGIVVHEGELATLRRFKDDVKEVATGYECGIVLNKFNDIKEGDILEAFVMEEIKR